MDACDIYSEAPSLSCALHATVKRKLTKKQLNTQYAEHKTAPSCFQANPQPSSLKVSSDMQKPRTLSFHCQPTKINLDDKS